MRKTRPIILNAEVEAAFWSRVVRAGGDECWTWSGGHSRDGYGVLRIVSSVEGTNRDQRAHRVAWTMANGPIPDGLLVCHRCDNRGCVRADHLFLGTDLDNAIDRDSKGRQARGTKITEGRSIPSGDAHWTRTRPTNRLRGAAHGCAKLSAEQVSAIRERYRTGGIRQRDLASEYKISQSRIWAIVNNKSWVGQG